MTYGSTHFGQEAKAHAATKGAEAHKLADKWYVVTRGEPGDLALEFFGASTCATVPDETIKVAVRYYVLTGRLLLREPGGPVLTAEQIEVLSIAREPWGDE